MKYVSSGRVLFAALFVILLAVLIVTSLNYNTRARTFPLIVAIPVFIGAVGNLIQDVRYVRRGESKADSKPKTSAPASAAGEPAKKETLSGKEKSKRELVGIAWLIGYVLAIVLIGFPLATIAYMIVFIRFYNKESWKLTITYTVLLSAFIWIAFVYFLKSTLYQGMVFDWLGI